MKSGIRIIRHMMPMKFEDAIKKDERKWRKTGSKKPTNRDAKVAFLGFGYLEKTFDNANRPSYDWWSNKIAE